MTRYIRRKIGAGDRAASAAVSLAVGAAAAAATYYVVRLFLSREAMKGPHRLLEDPAGGVAKPRGGRSLPPSTGGPGRGGGSGEPA